MNLPTVIVALVVAGVAFLAARSLRKSGSCDCGGGCSGCSGCHSACGAGHQHRS